jgi:hypothetical protein
VVRVRQASEPSRRGQQRVAVNMIWQQRVLKQK